MNKTHSLHNHNHTNLIWHSGYMTHKNHSSANRPYDYTKDNKDAFPYDMLVGLIAVVFISALLIKEFGNIRK